jgi:membrane-associated phospholipid phosphatase
MMKSALPLACIAALAGAANLWLQGPLPGEMEVTLAWQQALGARPAWAGWLTATAKAPLVWGMLVLAAMLAWRVAGPRAALAVPLAYGFAFAADKALRAALFAPRPDPALVAVADPSASSGLPSTFGLVYGALLGTALLARGGGRRALAPQLAAGALLVAGMAARIVLGGHWPSQMLASAAFGLVLAVGALAITRQLPLPRRFR